MFYLTTHSTHFIYGYMVSEYLMEYSTFYLQLYGIGNNALNTFYQQLYQHGKYINYHRQGSIWNQPCMN